MDDISNPEQIMKKYIFPAVLAAIILPSAVQAQITAAVIPFEGGDDAQNTQQSFVRHLTKGGQIGIVDDSAMRDIMAIHEQAQLRGSSLHDISKLKLAEFLIAGNLRSGTLTVTATDVNTGIIVFTKSLPCAAAYAESATRTIAAKCRDALLLGVSGADREPPDAAKPYLSVLSSLVSSLTSGDEASFRYLAVYSKGAYIRPDPENEHTAAKAKQFLKYFRPYFIRSNVIFISLEKKAGNVLITCVVNKAGSKTKHQIGFVELDDGTVAVLDELHKVLL